MNNKSLLMASRIALAISTVAAAAPVSGNNRADREARQIVESLERTAMHLESDADQFKMVVDELHLSSETHGERLMAMKEEINRMGREIGSLEAEQDALPDWERQVVIKTVPLLKDAAASTENAIQCFNENKAHLWTPEYRSYADRVCQDSEQLLKTLKAYVKLAKLHGQEQVLIESMGE